MVVCRLSAGVMCKGGTSIRRCRFFLYFCIYAVFSARSPSECENTALLLVMVSFLSFEHDRRVCIFFDSARRSLPFTSSRGFTRSTKRVRFFHQRGRTLRRRARQFHEKGVLRSIEKGVCSVPPRESVRFINGCVRSIV